MLGIISKPKKLLALVLAFVLMLSVVPLGSVFANSEPLIAVVDPTLTAEDGTTTDENGAPIFKTISAAIDSFGGAEGKIYLKGELTANGAEIEGTTADRAPITIAGYGDVATGGTLTAQSVHQSWLKGDITFENLTIGTGDDENGLNSDGYKITFGEGIVSAGTLRAGGRYSHNGNYIEFNSGSFNQITARYGYNSDPTTRGATHYVINSGVTVNEISAGILQNNAAGTINIVDDYVLDINGGSFKYLYLGSMCYQSTVATKADIIININKLDAVPSNGIVFGHTNQNAYTKIDALEEVNKFGNVAVVIDCAEMPGKINAYNAYWPGYTLIPDENKYFIFIANNYDASKYEIAKYDNEAQNINSLDYIIHTINGVAQPVFEDAIEGDATSSVLKGFTFESNENNPYLIPTANGVNLIPTGEKTADGKNIYDLSAYKGTRTAKTITNSTGSTTATHITDTQPVTIDFIDASTPVVTTDEEFVAPEGCKVYSNINDAIASLGSEGGVIYIKGAYEIGNDIKAAFANTANIADGKSITILGWEDANTVATSNSITFGNEWATGVNSAWLHCDLTFDNITVIQTKTNHAGFYSNSNTLTFGKNVLTTGSSNDSGVNNALTIGYRDSIEGPASNNIVINGGNFEGIFTAIGWFGDATYNADTNITLNGGNVSSRLFALGSTDCPTGTRVINGDINYTVNGSDDLFFYGISLGGYNQGANNMIVNGNITYRLNGLKGGGNSSFDLTYGISLEPASGAQYNGNIAVIFDLKENFWFNTIVTNNLSVAEGKKVMLIANNLESTDIAKWSPDSKDIVHYLLEVTGGSAEPVYDETTNNLKGFELKGPSSAVPFANGTRLTAGADGLYDLSAFENQGVVEITFDYQLEYGKYYVAYGGTGNGSSPATPAPSVAWLINNVIADNHTADETIEVYIMQDDAEILYNSTAYVTNDANYQAAYVGNNNGSLSTADAHFTAWNSNSDGTTKYHAATIKIMSYEDGSSEKNYIAFSNQIGANANLIIQGPTIFDNVITLCMRNNARGIMANGYDLTLTENLESKGLNADQYGAYQQWDGSFHHDGDNYGPNPVIGNSYAATNGAGGVVRIENSYSAYSLPHARGSMLLGSDYANVAYTKPVTLYFDGVISTPLSIGSASAEHTSTFTDLNIIINSASTLNVTMPGNIPVVSGAIQLVRVDSADDYISANLATIAAENNVPFWNLETDTVNGAFVDITDTNGVFEITKEGISAIAVNDETQEITFSKAGILDLSGDAMGGTYKITSVDLEKQSYLNLGTKIVALKDVTIDLSAEEYTYKHRNAFMGWKLVGGDYPEVNGTMVELKDGQQLEATYLPYDTATQFNVHGSQMRVEGDKAIRFIINKYDSLEAGLASAGATFPEEEGSSYYGTLILPTDYTHGKDMFYGEPIYSNENSAIRGYGSATRPAGTYTYVDEAIIATPLAVEGKNTFSKIEDANGTGIQYTVCLTKLPVNNYYRNFSVQGYLRYIDNNGVEQVIYSDYGQSSLYLTALYAAQDEKYKDNETVNEVIDYVQNVRPEMYKQIYETTKTDITDTIIPDAADYTYLSNLKRYKYTNNFYVNEFAINWDYNDPNLSDSLSTEVVHITDAHLNYVNAQDFSEANPILMSEFENRFFNCDGGSAPNAIRAMEYSSMADKAVLTGDFVDFASNGCVQLTKRLFFNYNTNIDGTSNVVATIGNHEPRVRFEGKVEDTTDYKDILNWLQDYWPNSVRYHSEIVTNDNGKNPVKIILLDNSQYDYDYTEAEREVFENDLASARADHIPVLIFQHEPISDGTTSITTKLVPTNSTETLKNSTLPGGPEYSHETSLATYKLITDYADVIQGVFGGHYHEYFYNEIKGTGPSEGYVIPQMILASNSYNGGHVTNIKVGGEDEVVEKAKTPLTNTYNLLTNEKELTIGYLGGSITYGGSAKSVIEDGVVVSQNGNIMDSWVNRTSTWFAETYDADITTVNAGLSDTATNFGLFRLEKSLMNTNGHDMPDLVFVEYTTNDWIYNTQSKEDLKIQIESLFRNIWELNPNAEIVVISTAVGTDCDSRDAYIELCNYYGIPFVNVGQPLQALIEADGHADEYSGPLHYTADGLHPSALGYEVYFNEIRPVLEDSLSGIVLEGTELYNYKENMLGARNKNLITAPQIIEAADLAVSGEADYVEEPFEVQIFGTETASSSTNVVLADSYLNITGNTSIRGYFNGPTFGLLFNMVDNTDINLRYRIDNGEWKTFGINDTFFGFQRYGHKQVFMLAHNLSSGEHIIEMEFTVANGDKVILGGLLANR